jgi:hypothetical protein
MTNSTSKQSKPQVRSVIVSRGWLVVDRLHREPASEVWPLYGDCAELARFKSSVEPPLTLSDGTQCRRYGVVRARLQFDFARKYMGATQRRPQQSPTEADSDERRHEQNGRA